MSQQELLKKVIKVLEDSGIEYMITGSIVSSMQGEPRTTHDIDLVITIQESEVFDFIKAFTSPEFYLDENDILNAIRTKSVFNLLSVNEGDKIDFWLLTDEPFDRARFSRKKIYEIMGIKMQVSSPEDTILMKLKWTKLSGGSEKQFTDALRVYEVQFEKLDINYIERWLKELGIESLWERLIAEAKTM